ncbi:MAG TPA: ABC transporter permease [Oscillospiraceae bacterium]|nr:ABC transporter permease [Oscillospiraceae bacterium]HPF55948.1 ABC transporter permease [Clostridiales bacterium]HPK36165.1 ABC transporter permease [Oscillospiraceae bacterium]HPR76543.1 ABC transporter permease [Oscillospiraceae bacterium]
MFFRQAFHHIFRSKKKSVSLFLILFFITLILCLGISVSSSISEYLESCRTGYTTIGLFEYMGTEYPDDTVYDPGTADAAAQLDTAAIESSPYVEKWDSASGALGYVEGYTRFDDLVAYRTRNVSVVRVIGRNSTGTYDAIVIECLYSYYNRANIGIIITSDIELTEGHYYLLHSEYRLGVTSYKHATLIPYENGSGGISVGIGDLCKDVTNADGGYTLPEESILFDIAETYRTVNNSVTVFATSDLDSLYPFNQQKLSLTQGRAFTQEEYDSGADVCIVSEYVAEKLGISVGDTIDLSIAAAENCSLYDSYWSVDGFDSERIYTVVGLTNTQNDMRHYVFIPKNDTLGMTDGYFIYALGQAVIDNDSADEFYARFSQNLPDRVRLLIYDQGYAAVTKPFSDILHTAVIITSVCAAVGLAVIVLLGFLFVQRQKKAAEVMIRLGAGRKNVYAYLVWGAGLTAAAACLAGGLASWLLSGRSAAIVSRLAENRAYSELLYSNSNLSLSKTLAFTSDTDPWIFAAVGGCVLLLSVIACFGFAAAALAHPHKKKKSNRTAAGPRRSAALSGGALKYAGLSIVRGGFRSAVPVLLAACAVLLMFRLIHISNTNKTQLADIYESTTVSGTFTDINGTELKGLSVEGYIVNELNRSNYVSDLCVTKWMNFSFVCPVTVNGEAVEIKELVIPSKTSYSYETFMNNMKQGPLLIMTNDFYSAPEFYYSSLVNTEFSDGYDASVFAQELSGDYMPCMVSTDLMAQYGVYLGDIIRIAVFADGDPVMVDMIVIGSYVKDGVKDNIYCPLAFYISPAEIFDTSGEAEHSKYYAYTFDSVSFTVKDSAELTAFKTWLSNAGYSTVNHIGAVRCFVVLDDRVLLNTARSLQQRIRYTDTLFALTCALTELLGFVTAYIMALMRRDELAVMRSLGTPKRKAFLSLFAEQMILCLPTVLIMAGAAVLLSGFDIISLLLAAGFAVCWLAGSAVSIARLNADKAILLTRKDE